MDEVKKVIRFKEVNDYGHLVINGEQLEVEAVLEDDRLLIFLDGTEVSDQFSDEFKKDLGRELRMTGVRSLDEDYWYDRWVDEQMCGA